MALALEDAIDIYIIGCAGLSTGLAAQFSELAAGLVGVIGCILIYCRGLTCEEYAERTKFSSDKYTPP